MMADDLAELTVELMVVMKVDKKVDSKVVPMAVATAEMKVGSKDDLKAGMMDAMLVV